MLDYYHNVDTDADADVDTWRSKSAISLAMLCGQPVRSDEVKNL